MVPSTAEGGGQLVAGGHRAGGTVGGSRSPAQPSLATVHVHQVFVDAGVSQPEPKHMVGFSFVSARLMRQHQPERA
jgi:hypothetical protein